MNAYLERAANSTPGLIGTLVLGVLLAPRALAALSVVAAVVVLVVTR